jgi:hypothetical protein
LLNEGNFLFWRLGANEAGHKVIGLLSLSRVADAIGLGYVRPQRVLISLHDLSLGLGQRRAINFAAELRALSKGTPQARFTIQRKTGVWRRTQQRYDQRCRHIIEKEFNIVPDFREWYGSKQFGNTYYVDLFCFRNATLRKRNGDLIADGRSGSLSSEYAAKNRRKYYWKAPRASKVLSGSKDVAVYRCKSNYKVHGNPVNFWQWQELFPINDAPLAAKQ